jgi:uncharacterized RDD family membrane protein YckC
MQDDNPYAAPLEPTIAAPLLGSHLLPEPASQGKRFSNYVIDRITFTALFYGMNMAFNELYVMNRADPSAPFTQQEANQLTITLYSLSMLVALCYYLGCEVLFGRTLGKLLTSTRVVSANGGVPTAGQLVGRTFARLIPFDVFSFLMGNNPVGWHDSLSGTRVIEVR